MQIIFQIAIIAFLGIALLCILAGVFFFLFRKASENDPNSAARAFVGAIAFLSKSIVGLAIIVIILVAISTNIVSADVGFPFVTSIATYLLVFNTKDIFNNRDED